MKRNFITILLLVCSVLLVFGSVILYRHLTVQSVAADVAPEPAAETVSEPAAEPTSQAGADGLNDSETQDYDDTFSPAIDFEFTDREGERYKLSEYYGKPIILNFWATWCGPCKMELPYFNAAFANYGDQIQFLMLDLVDGSYDTVDSTIAFVEKNGYSFPLFFDSDMAGAEAYGVSAIPMTVVINAEGKLVETHVGSLSEADLQELIDLVLK